MNYIPILRRVSLALMLLCAGCLSQPAQPKRLNISFNTMPASADPRRSGDFISSTLICMLFEGLTRCLPDGNAEMALAETVEISRDGLTYLFRLRPSLWSDGAPVTASDFERSWKAALNPEAPSLCAYLFYPIKNAEKAYKGQISPDEIGIRVLSDSLLEVSLEKPTPYFLSLTAFPSYLPTPSHALAQFQDWMTPSAPPFISNGPFLLESIQSQSHLVLRKNGLFWNAKEIRLDEIQIAIISNETTALQMFSNGELDWLGGAISPFPLDSIQTIRDRFPLLISPMSATTFCVFKNEHPLLKNRHLRLALALSINRIDIAQKITQLGEIPATSFLPPSLSQCRTLFQTFDPDLARWHLTKSMEELQIDASLIRLNLALSRGQLNTRIAQTLQTQWKEILGLEITLDVREPQSFRDLLFRREFDLALAFWIAQFSDPINILERFEDPKNWKNYPGWDHPEFRQQIGRVRDETDPLKRHEMILSAEEILADEMPLAPIYHWSNATLCDPSIKNLQTTPGGGVQFERCYRD